MGLLILPLLGPPVARHGSDEIRFPTRKALALLAYLAAEPAVHSRERLIGLFWSESDLEHGRTSLRTTLSLLRRALGETEEAGHLRASQRGLALRADSDLMLDLRLVSDAAELARTASAPLAIRLIATLEQANGTWRGDFAEGLDLPDAPDFEEWLNLQRETWRGRVAAILGRLSGLRADAGDIDGGLEVARRWVALDRYSEPARRRLIELRLASGDRAGALAEFSAYEELLHKELGAEPEPETRSLMERASRPRRSVRRDSELPLTGREAEHAVLATTFRSARARTAATLVIGEPGLGKTRLAQEFLGWAEAHGADILRGRGFEIGGRLPHQPIAEALRQRLTEDASPDALLPAEPWRSHLARLLPELGVAPPGHTAEDRVHLYEAVTRFISGLAASGPVVLAIDDLQWSDEGTLDMLRYAARRLGAESRPFLLLGCIRLEDLATREHLASWVAALEREVSLTRVSLVPLDLASTTSLLVTAGWPPELADRAQAESGGNPLFLVETLRDWRERGQPTSGHLLAPGVREAIRRRLAGLDADSVEAAGAAAVLGLRFDSRHVAWILDRGEMQVLRAIEQLALHGLATPASDVYEFTHDRIRESIYEDLPEPRRRLLHRRALEVLRTAGAAAAQTVEQAEGAGLHELAAELSVQAGDAALGASAGADAARHYRRALVGPPAGEDLANLHRRLGDALRLADRMPEAAAAYSSMLAEARTVGNAEAEVSALNRLALVIAQSGQPWPEEPEALLVRALGLASAGAARIETQVNLSLVLMYANRLSEALALGRVSLAASDEAGSIEVGALAATAVAQVGLFAGAWDEASRLAARAATAYRQFGNLVLEANALAIAAGAAVRLGEPRRGAELAAHALGISEELDNSWGTATALFHFAEARLGLGEPAAALVLAERGLTAATHSGFTPLIACHNLVAGRALLALGEAARAESSFSAGLVAAAGQPLAVFEEVCLSGLGATRLIAGDVAGAANRARQALERRSESSPFCIELRPWDAAALALGSAPVDAATDIAALERDVGGYETGQLVVERARMVARSSLPAVLEILGRR